MCKSTTTKCIYDTPDVGFCVAGDKHISMLIDMCIHACLGLYILMYAYMNTDLRGLTWYVNTTTAAIIYYCVNMMYLYPCIYVQRLNLYCLIMFVKYGGNKDYNQRSPGSSMTPILCDFA